MSLTVTVRDEQTGETETTRVPDGDYLLICVEPCYLHSAQGKPGGNHTLTVRGRAPKPLPAEAPDA